MSLVQAIDQAVAFVRAHPDEMTRAEMDEFHRLAESVYLFAFRVGLDSALPQMSELRPQLESDQLKLPPPQFESKLHLPGDWERVVPARDDDLLLLPRWQDVDDLPATPERVFLVCASPRWVHDMDVLRKLAEQRPAPLNTPEENEDDLPPSWDRQSWEELQERLRRLLQHMLGRERDTIANIADTVWATDSVSDGAISTATTRANEFLRKQRHPQILSRLRGELRWE